MRYISTRGQTEPVSGAEAILQGLAPDGGLFVPEHIPALPEGFFERIKTMDYPQRATAVLSFFLPEFGDLNALTREAYARFDGEPAPLAEYGKDVPLFLELWHGPTCAFKDMALQVLPRLVGAAKELTGETRDVYILTATSGDTGKAALEGFRDIPGTRVLVFYPEEGVSEVQKLQMVTQEGGNVGVCAVRGDFDDAQTGVKRVFANTERSGRFLLTSANSINLGRLLPQIAYYVSAYADFVQKYPERAARGNPDVYVPTGNFGNILAALYAKRLGVPLGRLVCVSNRNNVLTGVIQTGVYDRNRPLVRTTSPSMDILVSSNFERAVYLLSGCDSAFTRDCMQTLNSEGRYALNETTVNAMREEFDAVWRDDAQAEDAIRALYQRTGAVIDPHTATAAGAARDGIVVATAHPGKFPEAVQSALDGAEFPIPGVLLETKKKPRRFSDSVAPGEIEGYVKTFFGM
ncbi:MAG: threonine synthase [Oscillospiraceae bacterium]|jgi:threonine synthase|nr:threonine synthase [Oscillospiraceae bacterium]